MLMDYAPEVHWQSATRIARLGRGDPPDVTRPEAIRFVADLKQRAREAGEIAARGMRMQSVGARDVVVVDRDGWVRAASTITQAALDTLDWPHRPDGLRRELGRRGLGAALGVGFALGSRFMLGQYDAFTGHDRLYLVAPNLYAMERARGFVPRDFRRWVAIHEQTHALQFEKAPWLREHLASLVRDAGGRHALDQIVATMTFLEGHADYVSDHSGRIRTAGRMRKSFRRKPRRGAGLLDKAAQYANGLEFCTRVRRLSRSNAVLAAYEKPENLPSKQEISDPQAWLNRVHG